MLRDRVVQSTTFLQHVGGVACSTTINTFCLHIGGSACLTTTTFCLHIRRVVRCSATLRLWLITSVFQIWMWAAKAEATPTVLFQNLQACFVDEVCGEIIPFRPLHSVPKKFLSKLITGGKTLDVKLLLFT